MRVPPIALALLVCSTLAAGRAEAVTVRDVIELSRAGLSDEVLIALIEVDNSIFTLDAPQILELRAAGVSERVIVAMIRSGRPPVARPADAESDVADRWPDAREPRGRNAPLVVIDNRRDPVPVVAIVPVPVPIAVPVVSHVSRQVIEQTVAIGTRRGFGRFINSGFVEEPIVEPAKPVYWGWGGKRRPDTWPELEKKDKP